MRKKKTSWPIIIIFLILLAAYALSVGFQRNARYAKVFHQFGKDCSEQHCSLDERMALAEKAVFHNPEFSDGYTVLGELHREKGEVPAALELHKKALGLDLKNERSLLALGVHYFNENDLAQSLRYLNHFDSFYNRNYGLNYYLGRVHERLGNPILAVNYYKKAHSLDTGNDLRAYARLGALEAQRGDVKEAFKYIQEIRGKGEEDLARALEAFVRSPIHKEGMPIEEQIRR